MHPAALPRALAVWNAAVPLALLAVFGAGASAGWRVGSGSPLDLPARVISVLYFLTTPVASLIGARLAGKAAVRHLRIANQGFFLLWLVMLLAMFLM